jgi:hypothetical protein
MAHQNFTIKRSKIPQIIAGLQQAGLHYKIPLFRALGAKRISLCEILRGADTLDKSLIVNTPLPVVCVLGDDDFCSTGPSGFPIAEDLIRWSKCRVIHGAGGEAAHYEEAIFGAEILGNCLFIETSSQFVDEWLALVKKNFGDAAPHTMVVKATDRPHPVMGTRQ